MNVVIAGCPRSGTSILGELFDAHPDFKYYFEPAVHHIPSELHPPGMWRWAMKNPIIFPEDYHAPLDGRIKEAIDSRTPGLAFNIEDLLDRISDARFIWIVRHPLDTVASLVPGLTGTTWMHPPRPPNYKDLMREEPYVRATHFWEWFNGLGFANLLPHAPLLVHYEHLVSSPRVMAEKILTHVEAPWVDAIDGYVGRVTNDPDGYQAEHQDRWTRKGHSSHVGRWRESITEEQSNWAWGHVRETAERFGYTKDGVEESGRRNP